jgi:hypothetical protein
MKLTFNGLDLVGERFEVLATELSKLQAPLFSFAAHFNHSQHPDVILVNKRGRGKIQIVKVRTSFGGPVSGLPR